MILGTALMLMRIYYLPDWLPSGAERWCVTGGMFKKLPPVFFDLPYIKTFSKLLSCWNLGQGGREYFQKMSWSNISTRQKYIASVSKLNLYYPTRHTYKLLISLSFSLSYHLFNGCCELSQWCHSIPSRQ